MKIKALLMGCLLFSGVASAQISDTDNNGNENYKAGSGDKSFEVNFSPFSGSPISINYLRGRIFTSDNTALRAGVNLAFRSSEPNTSFEFAIAPGIEQHFAGTSRLSPYIGAEVILGLRTSSASAESNGVTTETSGAYADGSNRGYFNFGLNGVLGCDYYFAKNIFLGIEAGYGINYTNLSQVQVTVGGNTPQVVSESQGSFSLAPSVKSALRLGFVF